MIKTKLFLNYMNRNIFFKPFEKFLEKGLRGELGNILELRTGYTCNNNCINCSFKHKKHLIDRNTEECKKILKNNRYERNLLIISGGEPTIRKDIFDLIAYARDIDYQWIQFRSNGRMFYYRDFAEKIVQLIREHNISNEQRDINHEMGYNFRGLDIFEFVISLHGHTSELHDTITEVSKSFDQTIQGIKNLLDLNQIVVVNVIINKMNYKYLLNIGKYLSNLGVKYIEFSFITSDENLFPNFNDITPKISDFQLHLPKVIDELCRKEKLCNILINNIPFCFINKNKFYSSEYFFPYDRHHMYKLVDLDITSTYYENQIKNNIKGEKCKYCINDPICFGLNKKYAEKIGFEELNPILGNLRDLVEKDKIELFKNLKNLKPSDLRFEFDDQKFKLDFNNIKSDVIALLSGGVDSTMGISLYAKNNKDKKIVMITFDESHSPGANESLLSSNYLMKRHKNIIKHFIVPIPYILSKKIIYEDIEEDYKNFGCYITCRKCKSLRLSYCIYLLKKYFGGDIIISGIKKEETGASNVYNNLLSEYSIKMINPLYDLGLNKKDVQKLSIKEGFISNPTQSRCVLGTLKSRLKLPKFDIKLSREIENRFHKLLESHGIQRNKYILTSNT